MKNQSLEGYASNNWKLEFVEYPDMPTGNFKLASAGAIVKDKCDSKPVRVRVTIEEIL